MAASHEDRQSAAALREAENRIVWTLSYLVAQACGRSTKPSLLADTALAEYQERFPPIPPEGPAPL